MASFSIQPHSRTPTPSSLLSALKRSAFAWKTQTASFPCATLLPLARILSKFETSIPVSASADPPLQVASSTRFAHVRDELFVPAMRGLVDSCAAFIHVFCERQVLHNSGARQRQKQRQKQRCGTNFSSTPTNYGLLVCTTSRGNLPAGHCSQCDSFSTSILSYT